MTPFEWTYHMARPFLGSLNYLVHRRLKRLVKAMPQKPNLLDVGGRKSPITISVPAKVTISDLPRESDIQKDLNLGITDAIMAQTLKRRSNITGIEYDDMTQSTFEDHRFDAIVSIEVLEHVEEDDAFVANVSRVLKPGGFFLMTTPNGDFVENNNPDHKRHYLRQQLHDLLAKHFDEVQVDYAIWTSKWRTRSLHPWKIRKPIRTVLSMMGSFINIFESSKASLKTTPHGTRNLVAIARNRVS